MCHYIRHNCWYLGHASEKFDIPLLNQLQNALFACHLIGQKLLYFGHYENNVALVKKHDFEDNLLLGTHLLAFYFNEYSNEKLHVWFVKLVLKLVT